MNQGLLNEKQAASLLNVSYQNLKLIRYRKEINFLRFGRLIRYRIQDLKAYSQRNLVKSEN